MNRNKEYFLSSVIPYISNEPIVLTGDSSMSFNGLSLSGNYLPDVLTDNINLKGMRIFGRVSYCYVSKVNTKDYIHPYKDNNNLLIPSRERSIIENIKYDLKFVDPGYFCDSLERYQHCSDYNEKLLKEVAEVFEVPWSMVEYWLKESEDYNSY